MELQHSKILYIAFCKWMLHLGNYIIFFSVVFKTKLLDFILKQYFVPILKCCWKTLRKYPLTYSSGLNETVMDCYTGRKCVHVTTFQDWQPQTKCKNDLQHTRLPSYSNFPHYRIYAHWEAVWWNLHCHCLCCTCSVEKEAFSFHDVNLAPFTSTTFTLKEKKWS